MFSPLLDIVKYLKLFQNYLGKRIYIILILSLFAAFAEGIGILMLLPLLESLDGFSSGKELNSISLVTFEILKYFGFEPNIIIIIILITVFFTIKGILTFLALGFSAYLIGVLLNELKSRLFNHYSSMNYEYYASKNTGHFSNLINEQPTKALESFNQLTILAGQFVNTVVLMTLSFYMTWQFGLMALAVGLILLIFFIRLNNFVRNLSRITASENGNLTKWLIQVLHGYKYLTSTSQTALLKPRVFKSIKMLTSNQVKSGIAAAFTQSVREPLAVLFIMAIVILQIYVFQSSIEPILVSIVLFYRALNSVLAVQSSFQGTFQHIGSMEIVEQEFVDQKQNKDTDGEMLISDFETGIVLENLSFSYKGSSFKAINSINLSLNAKESIAFVGESGSGKSTLVDMLTLLHKPSCGKMLIDGLDAQEIKKESWRNLIGYVSQETVIFNDSIANNISMWGGDFREDKMLFDRIKNAANQANILDFVNTLPDGFDTKVGDRGLFLSGGQKQRLFIAREIFRNPSLLILDEATSALDTESENEIQNSIDNLKGKTTLILIAHRLSTIKNVDCIYVLKNGEIIEKGTYRRLVSDRNSYFSKMVNLQSLQNA